MSDLFLRVVDDGDAPVPEKHNVWKVAVIDDEQTVHDVTDLVLANMELEGRPIELLHASSAAEGRHLLEDNPDTAMALLDVVMETPDAGLRLVHEIRDELHLSNLQIILRTGQPGYAPENDVIQRYQINDYKTKTELTRTKLITSATTAIRSHRNMLALEKSKDGLRQLIKSSASLIKERSLYDFTQGALNQIDALFGLNSEGIFCVSSRSHGDNGKPRAGDSLDDYRIVATSTKYKSLFGQALNTLERGAELDAVERSLRTKHHVFGKEVSAIYLSTPMGWQGVMVFTNCSNIAKMDEELLNIFCLNVSLGLENATYFSHLQSAAYSDEVTGLCSRKGFLEQAPAFFQNVKKGFTVLLLDIDYFHRIIESLGYEYGNQVLRAIAELLKDLYQHSDCIARLHTDVFAVLLDESDVDLVAITKQCSAALNVEGGPIRLGVTLGAASCSKDDVSNRSIETLLRQAEMALKVAKDKQRGTGEKFNIEYENSTREHLEIVSDLRAGFAKGELFMQLQPKVNIRNNTIIGYEALVRWRHPIKGMIPPAAFVPIAENSGLNRELDMYVFKHTLQLLEDNPEISEPVSINISANTLPLLDIVRDIKDMLDRSSVSIEQLELEITENALVHNELAIVNFQALKNMGFTLCLDDFGTGYSSLSYLHRLPLDVIKIDRSFVSTLLNDPKASMLCKGMVDIAFGLDKKVVVEGVETIEQLERLREFGVECVQGFYFYKPMDIAEVLKVRQANLERQAVESKEA